jgi:hypothetical protein
MSAKENDQIPTKQTSNPLKLKIKEEMKRKIQESHLKKQNRERVTERAQQDEKQASVSTFDSKFSASIRLAPNQDRPVPSERKGEAIVSKEYNNTIQSLKNSIEMLKNSRILNNSDRSRKKLDSSGSPNNTIGCIKNQSNKLKNVMSSNTTYEEDDSMLVHNNNTALHGNTMKRNDSSLMNSKRQNEFGQVRDLVNMLNRDKKNSLDRRLFIDEPREKGSSNVKMNVSRESSGCFANEKLGKSLINTSNSRNKENNEKQDRFMINGDGKATSNNILQNSRGIKTEGGIKGMLIENILTNCEKNRQVRNTPSYISNNRDKLNESSKIFKNEITKIKAETMGKRSSSVNRSNKERLLDIYLSTSSDDDENHSNFVQTENRFVFDTKKSSGNGLMKGGQEKIEKRAFGSTLKDHSCVNSRASELKRNFEMIYREYKFNKKIAGASDTLTYAQNM